MKKAIIIITLLILLIGICICEEVVLKDLSSKIESISTSLYNNISINEYINDNDEGRCSEPKARKIGKRDR